ncbi:MAG: metallophosphoesterase [Woeseiaceae bacterium]
MKVHGTAISILLALLAAWPQMLPAAAGEWRFDDVERVVAISDIHGAYKSMVATLQNAGVLDADLAWSDGQTHLVIVGDILDRGPASRDAMDLLMRVEKEAESSGGKVHVLIGNHEAMNLVGDLRYVSKEEFAAFADDETAEERERWFLAYAARKSDGVVPDLRAEFERKFPPGFFAHRREFSSTGRYGKWLLSKPIVVVINETAFIHGGLSPLIGELGLEGVNETLIGELIDYVEQLEILKDAGILLPTDNFYDHLEVLMEFMPASESDTAVIDAAAMVTELNESDIHATGSPLWYRGNVGCSQLIEGDRIAASLQAIGAVRVIIGHTPTPTRRILRRLGGRVFEIDTGMFADAYSGSGNALILEGGRVSVINESSTELLSPASHPRQVGRRPGGFLPAQATEALLARGEVTSWRQDENGRSIVTVSDGSRTVDAVFVKRAGKGFYPDVAAYRLDRLLELGMVPVTVRRRLKGRDGALQFLPRSLADESKRAATGRGYLATCPLQDQWVAMFVFDALMFNEGRNAENMLYDTATWQLILVDHKRAFRVRNGRPPRLENQELAVGAAWKDTLAALTDDVIEDRLGDVLGQRRRRALGTRRDELLSEP